MQNLRSAGIRLIASILLSHVVQPAFSLGGDITSDTRSLSLGGIKALSREMINPAYLSFHSTPQAGTGVFNQFQIKDLTTSNLHFIYPNNFLDAGIKFSHYGYEDYRLLITETGLSKKIRPNVALGAKIIYLNESTLHQDNKNRLYGGIGLYFQLSKSVSIGVSGDNSSFTINENRFRLQTGIDYKIIESCHLLFEVESDFRKNSCIHAGIEYQIVDQLFFRAGMRTNPSLPSLGAAYRLKHLIVGLGVIMHQTLGNSHSIEVLYQF